MVYSVVTTVTIIPIMSFSEVEVLFSSSLFMCLTNMSSCKVALFWFVLFTTACAVLCACFSGLQLSSPCVFPCIYILCTWVWSWWLEPGLSSKRFMFWWRTLQVICSTGAFVCLCCSSTPKAILMAMILSWSSPKYCLSIVSQISSLLSVTILVHSSTARLSLNHSRVLLCTFIFFLYSV